MEALGISCKGEIKHLVKWKTAKEGVRISCYLEELYRFNPMIDPDLVFSFL